MSKLEDAKCLTVMLHGVKDVAGWGWRESCDMSDNPDGYNVWLRADWSDPNEHGEPFSSIDAYDADFQSLEAADLYANALAESLGIEIEVY